MAKRDPLYGWEANRRRKLVIGLDATPEQRLDWLEEMIALAHASGALPRRRDYVLPLKGSIKYDGTQGYVLFATASFVSTREGKLSFTGSWGEVEERWSMRLERFDDENFVGDMSAPRQLDDYRIYVSAKRTRIMPHEWEIRGTYTDDSGELGQLILRVAENSYG